MQVGADGVVRCDCPGCGRWQAFTGGTLPGGPPFRQYEVLTADLVAALATCLWCPLGATLYPRRMCAWACLHPVLCRTFLEMIGECNVLAWVDGGRVREMLSERRR